MSIQEFQIYNTSTATPDNVVINIDGNFYFISINGVFQGLVTRDDTTQMGYMAHNEGLQPYMYGICFHLKEISNKQELAGKLKRRYVKNIIKHHFISNDLLKIVTKKGTDLSEFGAVIKDVIYADVTFASRLLVVLSVEDADYTTYIQIN